MFLGMYGPPPTKGKKEIWNSEFGLGPVGIDVDLRFGHGGRANHCQSRISCWECWAGLY